MKATAIAPANIAFIKYWGQKNEQLFLPYNNSISMTLSQCLSTTTVEFLDKYTDDQITIIDNNAKTRFLTRSKNKQDKDALLFMQIDRLRNLSKSRFFAKIVTKNNFPADAGLASSSSGFAALTLALAAALKLENLTTDKKLLSELTRQGGSVSAMRSCFGGFVESVVTGTECYAEQIADENYWNLCDVIAIVQNNPKKISSSEGHLLAISSPLFQKRLQKLPTRLEECRQAILTRNFALLGKCIEADTLSMHQIMQTGNPAINYWTKETMTIMESVKKWRDQGIESYFSIDAGANVHVICQKSNAEELIRRLKKIDEVKNTIVNEPTTGVREWEEDLF